MSRRAFLGCMALVLPASFLIGCSTHVSTTATAMPTLAQSGQSLPRPRYILVQDFAVEPDAVTLDRAVSSLEGLKTGGPSFVDTGFRQLVPAQGRGENLRPERFPIRADQAPDQLYAA